MADTTTVPSREPVACVGPGQDTSIVRRLREWMGPSSPREWFSELLAGLVVCFAQLPESVAFANLANCPPAIGLQAAWIVGLVCALFGGSPGSINGSAGALAAVTTNFVSKEVDAHGHTTYTGLVQLFWSVIFASVLMLLGAVFRMGKLLCLIPATVVIGFCNGLGWVIGHAQLAWFQDDQGKFLEGDVLYLSLVLCAVTFVVMQTCVSLRLRGVPGALLGILASCVLEFAIFRPVLGKSTLTIRDKSAFDTHQVVPRPFFLNSDYDLSEWGSLSNIVFQGVTLALVAMLESLLCMEVMNDLTSSSGEANRQLWALGASNLVAGLLGTMGGNALIELCVMNVQSGGRFRCSSTVCALGLMLIFTFGYDMLNYIPVASLAGVMVVVVIGFVRWASIPAVFAAFIPRSWLEPGRDGASSGRLKEYLRSVRIGLFDAFIIVIVTTLTAVSNLAIAVGAGVSISALRFSYQQAEPLEIATSMDDGVKLYSFNGPIFFGARHRVVDTFKPQEDPDIVEIDFAGAEIFDFAIMQEFHPILAHYAQLGKTVRLLNLKDANHLPALLRFATTEEGSNNRSLSQSGMEI